MFPSRLPLIAVMTFSLPGCMTVNMGMDGSVHEQFLEAVSYYNPSCVLQDYKAVRVGNDSILSTECMIRAYPECEMSIAKRNSFFAPEADQDCISGIILPKNSARIAAENEKSAELARQALQAEKVKEQLRIEAFNKTPEGKLLIEKKEAQQVEFLNKQKEAERLCGLAAKDAADKYVFQVLQSMKSEYLGGSNYICWVMFRSGYAPFPAEINYNADTGRYSIRDL